MVSKTAGSVHLDSTDTLALSIVKLPAIRPNPKADPPHLYCGWARAKAPSRISLMPAKACVPFRKTETSCSSIKGGLAPAPINCETPEIDPSTWDTEEAQEDYKRNVSCLSDTPIPLTYYGTKYAAQDIDFVRRSMGIEHINPTVCPMAHG